MRTVIDRIYHFNDDSYKWYEMLKESQFWSQERMQAYQLEQFKKLWKHAITNVPYYRSLSEKTGLGEINSLDDLRMIPVLTKDIIEANFNNILAENIPKDRFVKDSTSGSSGHNFYFYTDAKNLSLFHALTLRKYDMMNISYFDKELVIWGAKFDVEKANASFWSRIKAYINNTLILSEYDLSDAGLEKICQTIKMYRPKSIKSYPSILERISNYIIDHDISLCVQAVHTGGEKMYDYQKLLIKKALKCSVYDFYGARDLPNAGMTCGEDLGVHIFQESVIFEVVNENNLPIEDGEGEIVVTNLHNYVMPFIRYRIGDRARISKGKRCKCGMNLQVVDEIVGRTFEVIQFPNGNRVGGTFWTLLLRSVSGIDRFQVVQEKLNEIVINYTVVSEGEAVDFKKVIEQIKKYAGDDLVITPILLDQIPLTKAGKMQFVISKVNKK